MKVIAVTLMVFESRNNMVDDLLLKHFCGGFLDGKMTTRLTTRGVCREKSVGWKCEGKSTRKSDKDTKSCGDVEPQVVCRRVI